MSDPAPQSDDEAEYYAAKAAYEAAVARLSAAKAKVPELLKRIGRQRAYAAKLRQKAKMAAEPREPRDPHWLDNCSPRVLNALAQQRSFDDWDDRREGVLSIEWVRSKGRRFWQDRSPGYLGAKSMAELDALVGSWDV